MLASSNANKIIGQQADEMADLQRSLDVAEERVVWCFSEDEVPMFIQGSKGKHELTEPVTALDVTNLVSKIELLRGIVRAAYLRQLGKLSDHDQHKLGRELATHGRLDPNHE